MNQTQATVLVAVLGSAGTTVNQVVPVLQANPIGGIIVAICMVAACWILTKK